MVSSQITAQLSGFTAADLTMDKLTHILSQFPIGETQAIESLEGAGGFSGAKFWRIKAQDSLLCLRRWPKEHPSRERLAWVHNVLTHAATNGCSFLPVPTKTLSGHSFIDHDGHLWELSPWLSGVADFHGDPSAERLDAALVALAKFHKATESFDSRTDVPLGITSRLEQIEHLDHATIDNMSQAIARLAWSEFQQLASPLLHLFREHAQAMRSLLQQSRSLGVTIQPCIRDIWHDHVLFRGNEVTGFVDFGAMRFDHVGCDISRLLGSLVADDRQFWQRGLDAYQSVRNLSRDDLQLVQAYDRSTVLLSGMNWVQWVAVEKRTFEQPERIVRRMKEIAERLRQM